MAPYKAGVGAQQAPEEGVGSGDSDDEEPLAALGRGSHGSCSQGGRSPQSPSCCSPSSSEGSLALGAVYQATQSAYLASLA